MKILLGVPEYPPHNIGGGGVVFKNLAENYKKLGHDVFVLYGYYPTKSWQEDVKKYIDKNGIKFYQIPEIPYPKSIPYLKTVMPCNLKAWKKLKNIIKQENPDVAHLHGYGHLFIDCLGYLCKNVKIKYIFTNHGNPKIPYTKNWLIAASWNAYKNLIGENLNKNAYKITCVSEFTKNEYAKKYLNKLAVIPNGVEQDYIECNRDKIDLLKKKLGIKKEKIILSVGRITKYKGFQTVLSILDQIENIKYLIIGNDQDYKKELCNIVKKNKITDKVIFIDKVDKNKLDDFYQLTDAVIVPSLVESFGLVSLEALKNKKCIISSGVQGLKYLKESKNVYEYNDNQKLIFLIKKNLKYIEEDFIKKFDWQTIAELYIKILNI